MIKNKIDNPSLYLYYLKLNQLSLILKICDPYCDPLIEF